MSEGAGQILGMRQEPLLDRPRARLGAQLHDEVFGGLPARTARALDEPDVAAAVRVLLDAGWRPAQIGARVGAAPAADEPTAPVLALLRQLAQTESPQQAWQRQRAERQPFPVEGEAHRVASDEERAHWVAEARRSLGLAARRPVQAAPPVVRQCASCPGEGTYFVTRTVRLCGACVSLLESGRGHLAAGA